MEEEKLEKVHLAEIYKRGKTITIDVDDLEGNALELLGFLTCYTEALKESLSQEMLDFFDKPK